MSAAEWIATRREIEQAATDGPWMSEWDTSDEWWTIHGQPNPAKGDERMVCPEVATLQHSEDWTADIDFITDTRTSLPLALDALEAALGFASRCAIACRAVGNSGEERRWLDLILAIESALRADS